MGTTIKCPFYMAHKSRRGNITVTCETIKDNMGFDIKNMIAFAKKDEQRDWMELFCKDGFAGCPYYRVILQKYDKKKNRNV